MWSVGPLERGQVETDWEPPARSSSGCEVRARRKGHAFEGVREVLNVHKGDILANLTDCGSLRVDELEKKRKIKRWHRDHGHASNIVHSYVGAQNGGAGEGEMYVSATTAKFFLGVRQAIDTGKTVAVAWEYTIDSAER